MMLRVVVSKIGLAGSPNNVEMTLLFAIANPIEVPVD
jgi:hypothetical protein